MRAWSSSNIERGFSLVETAIALVICGMLTVAFVSYWKSAAQQRTTLAEHDVLTIADQSLQGFAQAMFRLPCPDTNNDGIEDCGSINTVGTLPWKTLGIADNRAHELRYGVYRKSLPSTLSLDADLATARDRFRPLLTTLPQAPHYPITQETFLGSSNLIDFCAALINAPNQVTDPALLHTTTLDANGVEIMASRQNVAYALAAPGLLDADGDGNRFDGFQASQTIIYPVFDSPSRPHSARYDDQVRAIGFDQLFSALSCGPVLSATGHSHFNAATTAAIMQQYTYDYKAQLELTAETAGATVSSATGSAALAFGGLLNATAVSTTAVAKTLLSTGATGYTIPAGIASIVANTAAVATSVATLATAIAAKVVADQKVKDVDDVISAAEILADDIRKNALAADAAGF